MNATVFVLGSLACFRITWLISKDTITAPARSWIERKGTRHAGWRWLSELVRCPYCSSCWVGASVALFVSVTLDVGWAESLLAWWAFAGVASFLCAAVVWLEVIQHEVRGDG